MSYAAAAALQAAIWDRLRTAPALAGVTVADALVPRAGTGTFVLIGPEDVQDQSDKSGGGAEHRFVVSVISDAAGFLSAKTAAVAVSDALVDAPMVLDRGHLVSVRFLRAVARRLKDGEARRIDLTFRARVEI